MKTAYRSRKQEAINCGAVFGAKLPGSSRHKKREDSRERQEYEADPDGVGNLAHPVREVECHHQGAE